MKDESVLITGASGLLGHYLCSFFKERNFKVTGISYGHSIQILGITEIRCDLNDHVKFTKIVESVKPKYILHCAGLTNVDECEKNEVLATRIHVETSGLIAELSRALSIKMIHISTDHLWDGSIANVTEDTPASPLNAYGRTKWRAEVAVQKKNPDALIVRTNFFGVGLPWRKSFSDWIIGTLETGNVLNAFQDVYFTPISIPLLAELLLDSIEKNLFGIYHIVGRDRISKFEFAFKLAEVFGLPQELIHPIPYKNANLVAKRPMDMSLSVEKIERALQKKMPSLDQSLFSIRG